MDFTKLTAYLDSLKEGYGVPGLDIQITKDHEVIYRHMTGHSDYEGKLPVSDQDLYDVYSCSKVMTMIAVLQLVEQGKISLFDTLDTYIPEFADVQLATDFVVDTPPFLWPTEKSPLAPAKKKIYIHQLMSMTAGLSYDTPGAAAMSKPGDDTLTVVRSMAKLPLLYEPGDHFVYSLAHDVLAAVVEVVSGMRFRDYMKKYVFEPAGAVDMYYQVGEDKLHRVCAQYTRDPQTGAILPDAGMLYRITDDYDSGGAGLSCSVSDYSKVIDALACGGVAKTGNRILTEESICTMSKNWLTDVQMEDFRKLGKVGYGYGLGVRTLVDPTASKGPVGEFGWDGAAGAYCVIDPFNHISIFYAHEILEMPTAYSEIHPTIRDLTYEALGL